LYFLAHFYTIILKKINKILIIIQRSNGDVLFSSPLINHLYDFYDSPDIDILVNEDTFHLAKILPKVNSIHQFSYKKKKDGRYKQEKDLIVSIFKKYDLSINLTASDRSVVYALMASNNSISAIEKDIKKSWWKKLFLKKYYYFDSTNHILKNNLQSLNLLNIKQGNVQPSLEISLEVKDKIKALITNKGIKDFIIFHPSAQYKYKVYPENLRNELLDMLSTLDVTLIVTGSANSIDKEIKNSLNSISNVIDLIGETSLEEYIALSEASIGYIGMDTLNMHIAAAQDKRIFAIFGPTLLNMWAPWSNALQTAASVNMPIQTYGTVTIFQANMACVACGNAGCDDKHGNSDCLDNIDPSVIFKEVKRWYKCF